MKSKSLIVLAIVVALLVGTSYLFFQISGATQPSVSAKASAPQAQSATVTNPGATPSHPEHFPSVAAAASKKPVPPKVEKPLPQAPARAYTGVAQPEKTGVSQPTPRPGVVIQEGGETCATATVIGSLPFNATGYTCDNVNDYEEMDGVGCPYSSTSPDVVYAYTPAANEVVDITLCNPGTDYDTKLFVYENNCVTPSYACNDDACPGYVSQIMGLALTGGNTYYIIVDGYGGGCGNYEINVSLYVPCDVVCPPGGIDEGEPDCYANYTDSYNGGCNWSPYVFQPINCGDTICGTSGVYDYYGSLYREMDWFRIVLTEPTALTWSGVAEFPEALWILNAGSENCSDMVTLAFNYTANLCDTLSVSAFVPAGVYWFIIAPMDWGAYPCGVEYVAWLECEVPTTGACCNDIDYTCTIETPEACAAMPNHTFLGLGTTCTPNPCAPGNNCSNPIVVNLNKKAPGDTLYKDLGQTTCGKGHDYDYMTCLNPYDGGEDILYQINVTSTVTVDINMDDHGNTWGGVAIDDQCPPASPCMAYATGYYGPYQIKGITLTPGTYYIMIDTWPAPDCIPNFDLTIIEAVPCDVVCPPGAVLEGEPVCYDGYVDIYNGGCNSSPYVFQDITCPTTICGTSGVYDANGMRDTDWFRLVLTEGKVLTWSAVAEFPVLIFIIDAGTENCADYTILGSTTAAKCDTAKLTMCLPAGVYWLLVMPSDWGNYPCGVEYVAKAECEAAITGACCNDLDPYDCQILTAEQCAAMSNHTFNGICTNCGPPNPCLPAPANDSCQNAIALAPPVCPDVQTVYGTTIGATNDCPGVFDWPAVWYTFNLPFASNNLYVDYCPTNLEVGTRGIALLNSCDNCAGWIAASSYTWVACPSGYTDLQINWKNLPAGSYWLPVLAWDYSGYNMDFGFSICVEEAVPCVLTCPPNGIPEGEPECWDGYVDEYNGGCNSSPYIWQSINCGDTICGTSGVYGGAYYRDTDWFRVEAGEGDLTWTCVAEFPVLLFIMDAGSEDCVDYTTLTYNYTYDVCDTLSISTYVTGGVYWVWVGPVDWGNYPCGALSEYVAWVDCVPFGPKIAVDPMSFDQVLNPTGDCSSATKDLIISSVGGEDLNWSIAENPSVNWLAESPTSGTLPPGETATLNVSFNAGGMDPGDYNTTLKITSNAPKGEVLVPVHLKVELAPEFDVATRMWVPVIPGCIQDKHFGVDNLGAGDLGFEVKVKGSPPPLGAPKGMHHQGLFNQAPKRNTEDMAESAVLTSATAKSLMNKGNPVHQTAPSKSPKGGSGKDSGDTLFYQRPYEPDEAWSFYTSDIGAGYKCYENFADLAASIGDIHWWALPLICCWDNCDPAGMEFEITFYSDDPYNTTDMPPTDVVCTYSNVVPTYEFYNLYSGYYNAYYFSVNLDPPCELQSGWVSIQSTYSPNTCWSLLSGCPEGWDYFSYQEGGGALGEDIAILLTEGAPACPFTVAPDEGTVPPGGHADLTLTFDGTAFEVCGVETTACYLVFTSNDCDESQVVVPVYMWAARGDVNGDCRIDVVDVVFLLNYIFIGGPAPAPLCIGDVNRSGGDPDSDDVLYLISYFYLYGPPPVMPLAPGR